MDHFNTDHRIELIHKALEIMEQRAEQEDRTVESRIAYTSCIDMIRYALAENEECLAQYDY